MKLILVAVGGDTQSRGQSGGGWERLSDVAHTWSLSARDLTAFESSTNIVPLCRRYQLHQPTLLHLSTLVSEDTHQVLSHPPSVVGMHINIHTFLLLFLFENCCISN